MSRCVNSRRGVTLIEAVLYISVALGLIVGGLIFYQQAARAAQWSEFRRGVEVLHSEIRAMYQISKWHNNTPTTPNGDVWGGTVGDVTQALIAMQALPEELITPAANCWQCLPKITLKPGVDVQIQHARLANGQHHLRYVFWKVPDWICSKLVIAEDSGRLGQGLLPGIRWIQIDDGIQQKSHFFDRVGKLDMKPNDAASFCSDGNSEVQWVAFITQLQL